VDGCRPHAVGHRLGDQEAVTAGRGFAGQLDVHSPAQRVTDVAAAEATGTLPERVLDDAQVALSAEEVERLTLRPAAAGAPRGAQVDQP
jgi:hypothetical protein